MLRKIIFGIVISIIVIGGIYWFIYTKEARTPISDGINAIPSDAAIIFESKHAKSTWKKLSQTNIMWEELLGTQAISEINQQGKLIDSTSKQSLKDASITVLDAKDSSLEVFGLAKEDGSFSIANIGFGCGM